MVDPDDDRTPLPQLYTAAEVAQALQLSERYVADKCRRHEWPYRRGARGALRFTAEDYGRILELIRVDVEAPPTPRLSFAPRSRRYHR